MPGSKANKIKGTKEDDVLVGTPEADSIDGKDGNDTITGDAGRDFIDGGKGDDGISGGADHDLIDGDKGNDMLVGDGGNDLLAGGKGNDDLSGGEGNDGLFGDGSVAGTGKGWGSADGWDSGKGSGKGSKPAWEKWISTKASAGKGRGSNAGADDYLAGGAGNDLLVGGAGNDNLEGGADDDILYGDDIPANGSGKASKAKKASKGKGSDASGGSDYLDGGAGNDAVFGGGGDDSANYNVAENAGYSNTYDGGSGSDQLHLDLALTEWMDPAFQTDLAAYLQFLADQTDPVSLDADDTSFSFTAFGLSASAWETLTTSVDGVATNPVDEAAIAHDDVAATDEDTAISGDVLIDNGNGADEIPDYLRAVSLVSTSAGALVLDIDGSFSYDPAGAWQQLAEGVPAVDSFIYKIEDADGSTSTATVAITVTGVNDAPVAVADSAATDADTAITIDALANDSDIDIGNILAITSASSGSGGDVQIINNQLVFDPNGEFTHLVKYELEDVTLTYSIDDGYGGTDTTTVTVTVEGTNTPPEAVDDDAAVDEVSGVTVNVLDNDIDPDAGEVLTVTKVDVISGNGTATTDGTSVSWDPGLFYPIFSPVPNPLPGQDPDPVPFYDTLAADETATVTLQYTVEDRFAAADQGTVTITVTGENDAPIALPDISSTEENTILLINVLASDTDIDTIDTHTLDSVSVSSGAGSATVDGDFLSWDPQSDYDYLQEGDTATVVVDYTMSDNNGAESSSTATITVTGSNDTPVAVDDFVTTDENSAVTLDVLANDDDADTGDTRTLQTVVTTLARSSKVNNKLSWDPDTDYDYLAVDESATKHLTYTMFDRLGASSSATVSITITGSNDDPVAVTDVADTVENAAALTLDVLANDTDVDLSDTHTLNKVSFANGDGSASIVDNQLVWDQGTDFDNLALGESETVVGTYTVWDNHGGSADGRVEITVEGINDAPLAVHDDGQTDADTVLLLDVLANDTDLDRSDLLSITSGSSTGGGTVSIVNNQLQFDPNGQFHHLTRGQTEDVSLVYSMADGNGGIDTNTATITVVGTNTDPLAVNDSAQVNEDVNTVQIAVLNNDIDPDANDVLKVTKTSVLNGGGNVTSDGKNVIWTNGGAFNSLAQNETATVTLQYTVADSLNASDTAEVAITVIGSNDDPQVASTRSGASIQEPYNTPATSSDRQATGGFNFSDVDLADSHRLSVTPAAGGYWGALTAQFGDVSTGDGAGQINWTYTVADGVLDELKAGQVLEQNYSITIDDGHGGTVSHAVAITLNGEFDLGDVAAGNQTPVAVDNTLFSQNYDLAGYDRNSAGNGHYYKFVPANVDWYQAKTAADADGGYLVTITSAQENAFVDSIANGRIWLAGSDNPVEGTWRWQTGPEAGEQFWSGGATGSAPGGRYQNWISEQQQQTTYSEPNNSGGSEDYLEILGGPGGTWNDQTAAGYSGTGYVVEISERVYTWEWVTTLITFRTLVDTSISGWSYNSANGHFYKYVAGDFSWAQANSGAASQAVWSEDGPWPQGGGALGGGYNVGGHLVTITSATENTFVTNLIGNARAWLGATDTGLEGAWKWVTGPENGTQFFSGASDGSPVSGRYENFPSVTTTSTVRTEPNNLGNREDHLEQQNGGFWNDIPYTTSGIKYVIEIGGRPGDPDMPNLFVPNEDQSVTISGADLLVNDYDVDGDPIIISSVSPSTAGGAALTLNSSGDVVFNPRDAYQHLAQGATATDTFNYTIYDGPTRGSYDTARVSLTVTGVNDAPVAADDTGATAQDSTLFLNVLANDDDVDDGHVLNIVAGTTQSAQGSDVLAFANGDVRYAAHSASLTALGQGQTLVDTYKYTVQDGYPGSSDTATVAVTVTGINDRPVAVADYVSGDEESVINGNVLSNDYDPDNGDSVSMTNAGTVNIISVKGASVVLNNNGSFTYTGPHNFSGADSFDYTIKDTFGLTKTGTANITVRGVADAPTVSITTGAAARYSDVSLVVTAGLTDTTESGSFVFTGLPAGVSVFNQQGHNVTNSPVSFFGSSQSQTFTVALPTNTNTNADFDVGVTATSREQDTGDTASVLSNTENIAMTFASSSQTVDFTATQQNMWVTGDAYTFTDITTIEILDIHEGGEVISDSFSIPLIGTFNVDLDYSIDVDADLVSTLHLDAGSVNSAVPYQFDMTTSYNANADVLHIASSSNFTTGGSQPGSFDTFGPGGSYSLDLVFDANASIDLDVDRKYWVDEWSWTDTFIPFPYISGGHYSYDRLIDWHPRMSVDESINLFSFDDTDLGFSIPLGPLDPFLSVDVAWPSLDTSSVPGANNVFTSSGTSADILTLTLDVDQVAAYALNAALGNTTPSTTINPFDLTFGGDAGPIGLNVGVELLDFDVFLAANFVQDFTLEFEGFTSALKFENGSTLPYSIGSDIDLPNASQYDDNNDGDIDVSLVLTPDVQFTNDTDLGIDLGYFLGLVRPVFEVSIAGINVVDLDAGFLWDTTDRIQIAAIDVFEDTFDFEFEMEMLSVPVDTADYIV